MHTHDFLIYKSHKRHAVETVIKLLPNVDFIPSFHFIEKSINTSNGLRFVVASQYNNLIWESDFQSEKKADDFCALLASVYIIT